MKLTEEQLKNIIYEEIIYCLGERGLISEIASGAVNTALKTGWKLLRNRKTISLAKKAANTAIKQDKAIKLAKEMLIKAGVDNPKMFEQVERSIISQTKNGGGFISFGTIWHILKGVLKVGLVVGLFWWGWDKLKEINRQDVLSYSNENPSFALDYYENQLTGGKQKTQPTYYPTRSEVGMQNVNNNVKNTPKQNNQQNWNHKFPKAIQ